MKQDEKFLEEVVSVYQGVNLLTIKKTYRILSEMEPRVIESFVKKYSDFVIFLLNILDETRSANLLQLLTDSSLVYLAEEELRSLLIQVVGRKANLGEDFLEISLFMDSIDHPDQNTSGEPNQVQIDMLKYINEFRDNLQNSQFRYLERVTQERQTEVLRLLIQRNLSVAIGLMLYGSQELLVELMHNLAEQKSKLLTEIPDSIYDEVIRFDFAVYTSPEIEVLLPPKIQELVSQVKDFQEQEKQTLSKLSNLKEDQNITPAQARKQRLELLSEILVRANHEQLEIAMSDLIRDGVVQTDELDLIRNLRQ